LQPDSLQRLLADALTYKSPIRDLVTITKCGGDVNAPVKRGLRPLHYAVHSGYIQGIQYLLDNGADPNACDDIGYRPVHLCARKGRLDELQLLIDHGAKIDFFCEPGEEHDGYSGIDEKARNLGYLTIEPLNMALEHGHADVARLLLTHGARPDHHYFLGHEINLVPLDHIDCLKMLLEFGADPNVFSRCGLTPLMKACRQHNIRACRVLVENGAQLELQPPEQFEQKTALHFALLSGSKGICSMLVRHGAMLARPPGYRYSALHTAVTSDQPALCELVLRWEGHIEELTDEGSTPLQLACATPGLTKRLEIVEILLKHGANANYNSHFVSYGSPYLAPLTEYMRCATEGVSYDLVRQLVMHGAKVSFGAASTSNRTRDPHGILHCAQYCKAKPEVFHLLLSASTTFEVDSIGAYTSLLPKQREVLLSVSQSPRDLRTLCHLTLRDHMTSQVMTSLSEAVPALPVPTMVKNFLLFLNPPVYMS